MAAKEPLSAGKIAKEVGLTPKLVNEYIAGNKIKPEAVKGSCKYYDPKITKGLEKEYFLSAGNLAKKFDAKPAAVKAIIKDKGLEPDKVKGSCNYFGPKSWKVIEKGLK